MRKCCGFLLIFFVFICAGCGNDFNLINNKADYKEATVSGISDDINSLDNISDDGLGEISVSDVDIHQKESKQNGLVYKYHEMRDGSVWLNEINFTKRSSVISEMVIPLEIEGKKVSILGNIEKEDVDEKNNIIKFSTDRNIFGIYEDESFGKINDVEGYNVTKLIKKIVLPSSLKYVSLKSLDLFFEGTELDLSDCSAIGLDQVIVKYKWSLINASQTNNRYKTFCNMVLSKDGKKLIKAYGECDKLEIPYGVKDVGMLSVKTGSLFIPSTVDNFENLQENTNLVSASMRKIENVNIDNENKTFGQVDNAIYIKKNNQLVLIANIPGELSIPEGIERAKFFYYNGRDGRKSLFGYEGSGFFAIDLPSSLKEFAMIPICGKSDIVFRSKAVPHDTSLMLEEQTNIMQRTYYVPDGTLSAYKDAIEDMTCKNSKVYEFSEKSIQSDKHEKSIDGFKFYYSDLSDSSICIWKIEKENKSENTILCIPEKIDGKNVVSIGNEPYDIKSLKRNIFGGFCCKNDTKANCPYLTKIVLPKTLKKISPEAFVGLMDGVSINIPQDVESDISPMCTTKWKCFNLNKKNSNFKKINHLLLSKNGKKVYGLLEKSDEVIIPEGVTSIASEAFLNNNIKKITIPKSVNKIGKFAFSQPRSAKFELDRDNKYFILSSNSIFSRSGILVVAHTVGNKLVVPEGVKKIIEGVSYGGKVTSIVFPKTLKIIGSFWDNGINNNISSIKFCGNKPPEMSENCNFPRGNIYVKKGTRTNYISEFTEPSNRVIEN